MNISTNPVDVKNTVAVSASTPLPVTGSVEVSASTPLPVTGSITVNTNTASTAVTSNKSQITAAPFLVLAANPLNKRVSIKNTTNRAIYLYSTNAVSATLFFEVVPKGAAIQTDNKTTLEYNGDIWGVYELAPNTSPLLITEYR